MKKKESANLSLCSLYSAVSQGESIRNLLSSLAQLCPSQRPDNLSKEGIKAKWLDMDHDMLRTYAQLYSLSGDDSKFNKEHAAAELANKGLTPPNVLLHHEIAYTSDAKDGSQPSALLSVYLVLMVDSKELRGWKSREGSW